MYRRSTAETAMNPIGQTFPVIHIHLVDNFERNCCIWYVDVVLLVICTYVVSLRQPLFGHNCCIWDVVVVLLASAALRSVLVTNSLTLDTTAV